jgi:hypothetical protein
MTVQNRTTLKSYFITGASPSESDFGDLIDSALLVEDIVDSLVSTSTTDPLSASSGRILNNSINDLVDRVDALEDTENTFASNYYTKAEVDAQLVAVDTVINSQTYQSQINNLQTQIDAIEVGGDPNVEISISSVTGLQDALDLKATIAQLNDVRDGLIESINAIDTGGGTVDLTEVNNSLSSLTSDIESLQTQLADKAEADHIHGDLYTKTEVDTLISSIDTSDHTHVAADIVDLNTEIQAKTNLLVADHEGLTNNPHSVTKEQIGLGKVQNLSPDEIITQTSAGALLGIDQLSEDLENHKSANNPHGITKEDIGLWNVQNINAQDLIVAHLAEDNPHGIDISFFDVYAKAETDNRIEFYINSQRYEFTPVSLNDSAGAVGDFAYDINNLYVKIAPTQWEKIPYRKTNESGEIVLDAPLNIDGGITSTGDIYGDNITSTGAISTTSLSTETLTASISATIDELTSDNIISKTLSTENVTATGFVNSSEMSVTNGISSDTFTSNSATINGELSVVNPEGGSLLVGAKVEMGDVSAGSITGSSLEIGSIFSATSEGVVSENLSTGGITATSITSPSATITDLTATDLDANIAELGLVSLTSIKIVENKGDETGQSITYNTSEQRLKLNTESLAFVSDLPDLSNYALKSDLGTGGGGTGGNGGNNDGSTETDLVIDGNTGGSETSYAFTDGVDFYAVDYGPNNVYDGGGDDSLIEYWSLVGSSDSSTGLVIDYGLGASNPYIRYNILSQAWEYSDGTKTYGLNQAEELYIDRGGSNPYIRYDDLASEWLAFDGQNVVPIGSSTTIVNEGDTIVNEGDTIIQQGLTIDASSGGAENGYAFTEYDDGSGNLVFEKYAIDYGPDNTYGTSDDVDEDYFSTEESLFRNTGLTVDIGQDPNPSIIYNAQTNEWEAYNGTDTFELKDVDVAISNLVDSAPSTLNTLNELAAALGDDANFSTTTSNALGNRVRVDTNAQGLSTTQQGNARTNINAQVAGSYAASSHNHDGRYYTENEVDALLKAITDNLYSA